MHNFYPNLTCLSFVIFLFAFTSVSAQELVSAQDTVFHEQFTGNSFPDGWKSYKDKNLGWQVVQGARSKQSNTDASMNITSNTQKELTNLKVLAYTRELWLFPDHTYTVSFYYDNVSSGSATLDLLLNSTQDSNGGNMIETLTLGKTSGWAKHTYSFTVPNEGNYYIGFGISSITGDVNIHIDDLTVTRPAVGPNDLAVSSLPVTIISFVLQKKGTDAALTWRTAMEQQNKGFEVQASTDGFVYTAIGFVPAKSSNSTQGYSYTYTDKRDGKTGTIYYRLKQTDLDGQFEYFGPKAVDFGKAILTMTAYPNPFSAEVELTVGAATDEDLVLVVTDARGKEVFRENIVVLNGFNQKRLQLPPNLPAGLYQLSAVWSNQSQTVKLIKR